MSLRKDKLQLAKQVALTLLSGGDESEPDSDQATIANLFDLLIAESNKETELQDTVPAVSLFREAQMIKRDLPRLKHGHKVGHLPGLSYALTRWEKANDELIAAGSDLFYLLSQDEGEG